MPYEAGAIASAVAVGAFAFVARPALVDRTNTLLTAALVAGFRLLVFSTAKTTPPPAPRRRAARASRLPTGRCSR